MIIGIPHPRKAAGHDPGYTSEGVLQEVNIRKFIADLMGYVGNRKITAIGYGIAPRFMVIAEKLKIDIERATHTAIDRVPSKHFGDQNSVDDQGVMIHLPDGIRIPRATHVGLDPELFRDAAWTMINLRIEYKKVGKEYIRRPGDKIIICSKEFMGCLGDQPTKSGSLYEIRINGKRILPIASLENNKVTLTGLPPIS